jgi:deoxyribonuclease-4
MADHPHFGPAGVPPIFKILGAKSFDVPKLLRQEGLDAFEYQAVKWGQKPQMKKQDAEKLGFEAKKNNVMLSMHGSYYINLSGKKEIVEASKRRVIACAKAAQWMNASVLVIHAGFYGPFEKDYAFRNCVKELKDIVATMKNEGIGNVKLGPETMGRVFQIGSLDEILTICEEVEQTQLVIDWSHLHARQRGLFKKVDDFRRVVEETERRLGTRAARNMHCHFSKIEYTDKGERRHHILDEARYGPDFEMLAEVMVEFNMCPVIICETPFLDIDAIKMRDIFDEVAKK